MGRASGIAWMLVAAFVPGIAGAGCRGTSVAAADPGSAAGKPVEAATTAAREVPVPETTAVFTAPDGRRSSFRLEIADTPELREKGLMFRKSLPADRGMVFVFPADAVQTFWMRNTRIPLDMVFVEAGGRVAGVVEDARPLTLDVRSVDAPSRHVVELNGRVARTHGIQAGATVVFDPPLNPVER